MSLFGGGGDGEEDTTHGDFIDIFYNHLKVFPSNADAWWYFKDTEDLFNTDWVSRVDFGNTAAPRGHYILNPFAANRTGASGVPNLPVVSSHGRRPSQIAFYGGRVWYGGTPYPGYAQVLYFSQVLNGRNKDNVGKCYQDIDPAKPDGGDLLDSDGGTVVIPELQSVVKLWPYGTVLIVIGTNGIWTIGGSQGAAFKATDYAVSRASNIGALTASSFVEVDGLPIWWNNDGIYTVQIRPTGELQVVCVTTDTIQDFYNTIPSASKQYAHGAFNKLTKIIQWIYRSTDADTFADNYRFDKILCLNTITGAFYGWSVCNNTDDEDAPDIIGIIAIEGIVADIEDTPVEVGGVQVQASGVDVTHEEQTPLGIETKFKYLGRGLTTT